MLERFRGKYIIDWEFQYKDRTVLIYFLFLFLFFFGKTKKSCFYKVYYDLLSHLVCPLSANNVKCVRYLLQSEVRNDVSEASLDRALNVAVVFQNEKCIKILMSDKYLEENKKLMRDYSLRHWKEKSKAELFLYYLQRELSEEKCVETMNNLCHVMKTMVNDRKMISCDFYNVCYIYDKPQMWQVMYEKCRDLLNVSTLYKKPNDWQWLKEYLVHNRDLLLWLDPLEDRDMRHKSTTTIKGQSTDDHTSTEDTIAGEQDVSSPQLAPLVLLKSDTIHDEGKVEDTRPAVEVQIEEKKVQLSKTKTLPNIFAEEKVVEKKNIWLQWHAIKELCEEEAAKESKVLQETLLKDINANELTYKQICEFECNDIINSKYIGDQNKRKLRQDKTKFGLKSTVKEKELAQMSIRSSDHTANAKHTYDFVLYVCIYMLFCFVFFF
ncbi:hypothetical protein RFI_18121 [Reticulomyxa filosa]|uniref:Uncharacterized protein n=1 Tax=Reticulomyxa filosa TaxID=46433 RepID=X6MYJ8_RETFI|nr:hypothetical protein RFI_18121 [Reticulomyxa filosa]|eukprot:ETO19115.1 hypothetical protein RFI_18121 [Reticulomyxa filosa]